MCNVAKNNIPKVIFYFVQLFKKILYYFNVLNIFKITRVKKIRTFWRWVNFTLIKHKIFEGVNSLSKGWIIIKPPMLVDDMRDIKSVSSYNCVATTSRPHCAYSSISLLTSVSLYVCDENKAIFWRNW